MTSLFSLFRRRKTVPIKAADEAQVTQEAPIASDPCNQKVQWVALAFGGDLSELRVGPAPAAAELGPSSIEHLWTLFHLEHTPPAELTTGAFPGLGQWMTARQFAIFEIFYNFGHAALPILKRVAFGEYDWTQGNAIEVLCRLAADGVSRQEIVDGLVEHLPMMREEAHYYALGPLLHQSTANQSLSEVVSQLLVVPEFKQSYDEVVASRRKA